VNATINTLERQIGERERERERGKARGDREMRVKSRERRDGGAEVG
jgi:hypothetical protein